MSEHFTKATEARTALIAGDMETARAAMAWLATNELGQEALPEPLRPHLTHVREEAARFAAATTFSEAGDSFAAMLTHCGDCHAQAHMVPRFTDIPQPTGDALQQRMWRHAWASELLWEGLIAKDQSRYDRAASSIAEVVVRAADLPPNTNDPARVQAVADNVHTLAAAGLAASDWTVRAQDYGKFLATCATCHRMMNAGERVRAGLAQLDRATALPPAQP
jgi:cytochrome c553